MTDSARPLDRNRVEAHFAQVVERAQRRGLRQNLTLFLLLFGLSIIVFLLVPLLSGDGMVDLRSRGELLRFLRTPLLTATALSI